MEAVIQTLVEILKVESICGNEKRLCDWTESLLRSRFNSKNFGCELRRIGNSLVLLGPYREGRESLALAGHLDTVPGENFGDNVRLNDGMVIGLGASDMKSGVAIMLELMLPEFIESSPYNLAFVLYSREEGPYEENEIHQVLASCPELKRTQLCFVLEPTDNALHLGCMGTIHAPIVFHGRRAHSARPWQGENAVHKAAAFIARVAALTPHVVNIDGLEFKEVVSITAAHSSDTAKNVVPDRFELNLNYRFGPQTSIASAKNYVLTLVEGAGSVEFDDIAPSGPVPLSVAALQRFESRYALKRLPKQAYTDVAVFAQHGIAAVNCGPGLTAQAHQKEEYVPVDEVLKSYEIYHAFLGGR